MAPSFLPPGSGIADLYVNDDWRSDLPYAGDNAAALSSDEMDRAMAVISAWPEYRPSPLRHLPGLAGQLGIGTVLCKDEAHRFGVGGVKALGAPYGLSVLLERRRLPAKTGTAVAATDGNHGLALGWAANRSGCRALIFVGRDVSNDRLERIHATGAEIKVVDGTYDDAVLAAERRARSDRTVLLVTDTDYDDDRPVSRAIMAGYAVLAAEAWASDLAATAPTHVFLQCGVGGLAGGVTVGLWRRMSPSTPRVVTVEPAAAACMLASLRAKQSVPVAGTLRTRMAGLACGRLSLSAWNILSQATRAAMATTDEHAETVQNRLTAGAYGDAPLATGDTGVAGIAGLIAAASDPDVRARLGLNGGSRVLTINSEGPVHRETR